MEIREVEKSVEDWLNQGFAASTKRLYRMGLKIFLDYLNEAEGGGWTVEKLVSERLADLEGRHFKFEQRVVDYYKWLESYTTKSAKIPYERKDARTGKTQKAVFRMKGGRTLSDNARQAFIHAVRSFFAYHRLDLKLTKQQKRLLGKNARLVEHDYLFSIKDIEEMAKVGNPQERYILLAGKDVGLRAIDFLSLKQGHFARAIKQRESEEPPIFLGKIYTQKEGVYAHPFLTDDGLEAARVWLQILRSKGAYNDDMPMLSIQEKELTENLKRLALKAAIQTHGERVRFHCLRKFLIDRISIKMSESKWKQIVGKQIDQGAYVSPLELREAYASVMDRIEIPKPSPLNHNQLEKLWQEVEMLKTELQKYKDTVEALRIWPDMEELIEKDKLLKKLGERKLDGEP